MRRAGIRATEKVIAIARLHGTRAIARARRIGCGWRSIGRSWRLHCLLRTSRAHGVDDVFDLFDMGPLVAGQPLGVGQHRPREDGSSTRHCR